MEFYGFVDWINGIGVQFSALKKNERLYLISIVDLIFFFWQADLVKCLNCNKVFFIHS